MMLIEQLISFLIASSIVTHMIPEEEYKKCIKFFTGLVFIMLVVNAVFKGITVFDTMEFNLNEVSGSETNNNEEYYESIFNKYYGMEE